jgi:hypothetical protein
MADGWEGEMKNHSILRKIEAIFPGPAFSLTPALSQRERVRVRESAASQKKGRSSVIKPP